MNRLSRSIFRLETKLNVSIQTFKRQLGNNPLFENVQTPTQWIHTMMTKKRKVVIQPPKFLSLQPIQLPLFNFSELAGHGYFIFLALSYLESDLLNLRLFAFSGLTLSIIFQYYRDAPLWLSIRWNTLFVIINSVMIGLLIKKRSDAANMTEDQKLLHEKYFKNKGMSQIDFFHLISMAKRVEVPKGTTLIKMGQLNSKVYLVQKGELSVYKGDRKIGTIQKHQFAGEMSYLRWQTKKHKKEAMQIAAAAQSADDPSAEVAPDSSSIATTSITSLPNNEQREKEEPLLSSGPRGLASKLLGLSVSFSAEPNAEASSRDLVQSSPGMKEEEDGQEGQADVVCEEDGCVVYCWRFKDIYELISFNPLLGLVIERSFSEDLNHKMIHSRQEELLLRYKILVGHAVHRYHFDRSHHRVLASRSASTEEAASQSSAMTNNIHLRDHVYPKDFADLQKFCIINDISDFQQEHILQEVLVEEEKRSRDRVTEKIEGTALTQQYRELLKLELERPRGISEAAKRFLRDYRLTHFITDDIHVAVLHDCGWTLDEYELGHHLTYRDMQQYRSRSISSSSLDTLLAAKYGKTTLSADEDEDDDEVSNYVDVAEDASASLAKNDDSTSQNSYDHSFVERIQEVIAHIGLGNLHPPTSRTTGSNAANGHSINEKRE